MAFDWVKGHGTENDFVLLPDPDGSIHGQLSAEFVAALCDRRRGIGADGVLRVIRTDSFIGESVDSASEWFMDYRNADGSVSEMCGNGVRVFARYLVDAKLVDLGLVEADQRIVVGTRAGDKTVQMAADGQLQVGLGVAKLGVASVVRVEGRDVKAIEVNVGNPHAVVFVDDLSEAGALVDEPQYDTSVYPEGVNIEFVTFRGPNHIAMRVHERGSGETRSCGTGAVAAAVAAANRDQPITPVTYRVDVPGGTLYVDLDDETSNARLRGPAELVARGTMCWLADNQKHDSAIR